MTVIADSKKRVTLPTKPGERFDVQVFGEDKYVLTRLAPVAREVPVVKVKFNKDGNFECQRIMTREEIVASIRADRDAL
jgi:hypothetical protein